MTPTIQQLADSVRHLTAQIPREKVNGPATKAAKENADYRTRKRLESYRIAPGHMALDKAVAKAKSGQDRKS